MGLGLAIRAFTAALLNKQLAAQIEDVLKGGSAAEAPAPAVQSPAQPTEPTPVAAGRNDGVTVLAALQREARFVDIVKEPLGGYSDEQIGAAARDVLRDCGAVLDRLFGIEPLVSEAEGAELEAPADFDPGRYRLAGNVTGQPPFRGKLVHHGWVATRCELPHWSGSEQSASVVAPVELEVS